MAEMPLSLRFRKTRSLRAQGMKYKILFSFKQDSSKQVFKAVRKDEQRGVQQEVLLKIFLKENWAYQEEFESLSQVFSPYCVRLLGFENFEGKTALVLEYIKGVSLFHLVENFSLSFKEVNYILTSVYRGLKDLNEQGLCHGDLSLDNVLVDEQAHIKLIDFGKANYEKDVQGTVPFMAPEILKGVRANFLSDLYSLGVIETLMRSPGSLSSFKNMRAKDFSSENPLLNFDPAKRAFSLEDHAVSMSGKDLKLLSYKVKDLLSFVESRRCPTVKNPAPVSSHSSFFGFVKNMALILILFVIGVASSSSSLSSNYGWVKVYTNEWLKLRVEGFESYSPLKIPLKTGWHSIYWKNKESQGMKKVFVSAGKEVFLNDKSFLKNETHP